MMQVAPLLGRAASKADIRSRCAGCIARDALPHPLSSDECSPPANKTTKTSAPAPGKKFDQRIGDKRLSLHLLLFGRYPLPRASCLVGCLSSTACATATGHAAAGWASCCKMCDFCAAKAACGWGPTCGGGTACAAAASDGAARPCSGACGLPRLLLQAAVAAVSARRARTHHVIDVICSRRHITPQEM